MPSEQISHILVVFLGFIAIIIALAFIIKRTALFGANGNGTIKVIASLPLGTKERILLIDVGNKQLLLGASSANINTLHVFEQGTFEVTKNKQDANFSKHLKKFIQGKDNA